MRKKILFVVLIFNLLMLNGCWDLREINEIGMVNAVAIDKADSPGKYSVTVQIANMSTGASKNGDSKSSEAEWIGTQVGDSIFDAIRKLSNVSSKRIMWAHNNVIIIGEDLAKEGIIPVVDFFTHSPELRMKTSVVVAKGAAKQYLLSRIGMDVPSGTSFVGLESYRALLAESVESHMLKVSADIKNEYANPLIAAVSLTKTVTVRQSGEGKEKEQPAAVKLSGAAVFRRDKMIGWLSPEEARGVAWTRDETKDTVVTVTDPEHGNKSVSLETHGVKAKVKTKVVDDMPSVSIRISGHAEIAEEDGVTNQDMAEMKKQITLLLNKKIEDEITSSIETIQTKYKVDVLGFAKIVHAQNDKEWEKGLKDKWPEIFPQIPVEVTVDIKIRTSTLNQEPMKVY